ncbi:hypothetical protein CC80DRAFT_489036 [Byssothecium circinans]|uniref:C2H2-type domain-containing protein n=1 Tax=Byssothecium circinans TaxID=147558 RepID=A0A6A5U7X8_9PLEO|nr:hypothetical protein CC80DRAFT_489036 [Byssothecium circinans]
MSFPALFDVPEDASSWRFSLPMFNQDQNMPVFNVSESSFSNVAKSCDQRTVGEDALHVLPAGPSLMESSLYPPWNLVSHDDWSSAAAYPTQQIPSQPFGCKCKSDPTFPLQMNPYDFTSKSSYMMSTTATPPLGQPLYPNVLPPIDMPTASSNFLVQSPFPPRPAAFNPFNQSFPPAPRPVDPINEITSIHDKPTIPSYLNADQDVRPCQSPLAKTNSPYNHSPSVFLPSAVNEALGEDIRAHTSSSRKSNRVSKRRASDLRFECPYYPCNAAFPSKNDLKRHLHTKQHRDESSDWSSNANQFLCFETKCKRSRKGFSRKDHCVNHMRRMHPDLVVEDADEEL